MIVTRGGLTFEAREKHVGAPAPDPNWSYLDVNGHRHAWVLEEGQPPSIPSCLAMPLMEVFQGSEVRTFHYECALCGVPIEPGRIVATIREYLIDGHQVTAADYRRSLVRTLVPPAFWE